MRRGLRIAVLCTGVVCLAPHVEVGESAETDAIRGIQALHKAEAKYATEFGQFGSLDDLIRAPYLGAVLDAAIRGTADSYTYSVSTTATGYTVVARPVHSEHRSLYSDETLIIREAPAQNTPPQ